MKKNKLGEKIMKKFVALRPKTYNYFTDNEYVDKKSKVTENLL